MPGRFSFRFALIWALPLGGALACSTAHKKTTPELASLLGKRVALVDVAAEETSRKTVEVALVNQLVQRGSFELVSRQDVEAARIAPEQDPSDWRGIARRAGADVALRAKVLQFDADQHDGYSEERVDDSEMAAERGESERMTERVYKVRSLHGTVRVELSFTDLKSGDTRKAVAEREKTVTEDARKGAIHLPPSLRFLEGLANEAFRDFFDKNQ